jgi:hypothetical protein
MTLSFNVNSIIKNYYQKVHELTGNKDSDSTVLEEISQIETKNQTLFSFLDNLFRIYSLVNIAAMKNHPENLSNYEKSLLSNYQDEGDIPILSFTGSLKFLKTKSEFEFKKKNWIEIAVSLIDGNYGDPYTDKKIPEDPVALKKPFDKLTDNDITEFNKDPKQRQKKEVEIATKVAKNDGNLNGIGKESGKNDETNYEKALYLYAKNIYEKWKKDHGLTNEKKPRSPNT